MNKFPGMEKFNILSEDYGINDLDVIRAYFSFMMTAQKANGRVESHLSHFGTTSTQLSILLTLYLNHNKPETAGNISKKFGLSAPTISNVIKTLCQKKFIKKVKDKSDKRVYKISMTEEGYTFLNNLIPEYHSRYKKMFSEFTDEELKCLEQISLKLFHNLDMFD